MVGVPRSRGCSQCICRRIKTQHIIQKHGQSSMDEKLAPNLAFEAIGIQTRESFDGWLNYYFPSVSACIQSRVKVSWMAFLRSRWSTFPPALVWAIRALTALLMGASQGNKQAILCARHMYTRGIRHLASLLQTDEALTDETLAAAILLGGYEVLDGSSDRAWIVHARGINQLMLARGPSAHKHGMGRTLLMCWRPYIVAGAFIHGTPCFLGEAEWTRNSMTGDIARTEDEQGIGSLVGQTVDYAFNEVAKCPGYLAMTKETVARSPLGRVIDIKPLMFDILHSKENLARLDRTLYATEPSANFIGVIPSRHVTTLVRASHDCIKFAIVLLDHLENTLQSISMCSTEASSTARRGGLHNDQVWRLSRERSIPASQTTPQSGSSRGLGDTYAGTYAIGDRLDHFSLTMGLGSLSLDARGIPQLSANDAIPGYFSGIFPCQRP
ncbi:hypothetical protein PMG11_10748 [Penicillium brasilianum]|uniref:Transcription factor domain-containing protein n=1 Tax=Penicillium brasilianum TaxID=104259 RepID=A0A0F7U3H2_PENBI|nr:hypothetical protein PMG11_10748 [Penicillium brasilianum]